MSKKLLLIDDDVTALDIVDLLFEERGYEVERCTDGDQALEFISRELPDLILIDLMMPKMDGNACVMKIRELGVKTPVIAFTALDDPEVHQTAINNGCNRVITKPCKPGWLVDAVTELI
jgi:DNA-binding response OmpR family regulator